MVQGVRYHVIAVGQSQLHNSKQAVMTVLFTL
ncbi:unnamed protein product [Staurois parvus]|uniref:Uncharacterized protein n=1 Tax=Staurois parvus TaxID=386267 RepID=A0ABN9GRB5_9NEOB|nr:unnamed protein product [Staurois parvus]